MEGKKRRIRKTGNILHDVILISLAVMILILALSAYIASYYYNNSLNSFLESQNYYISGVMRSHENELQVLKDIATQMDLSGNARFLLDKSPVKSAALKKQINEYRAVNQFFDVMYSFYQKDHYLFNHSTSLELSFFCDKAYRFENCGAEQLRRLLTENRREMTLIPEGGAGGEMYRFYSSGSRAAVYVLPVAPEFDHVLVFLISSGQYDRLLLDPGQSERSTCLVYQGKVIASRSEVAIPEEALQDLPAEGFQTQLTIGGQRYVLTSVSGADGFSYVTMQNMRFFTDALRARLWVLLVIIALCCLPSALIIFLISRRMLVRVSTISSILRQDENERYELDRIESGIRNLVESSENMQEDMLVLQKNRFIRNFLRGDYTALEALRRDAAAAQIRIAYGSFMVGVLGSRSEANEEKAYEEIMSLVDQTPDADGYGVHLLNTNQRVMVLFAAREEALYAVFEKILAIGRKHCDAFAAAVSRSHQDLLLGSLAFIEANAAYDNRYLMDNDKIIRFTETSQRVDYDSYRELRDRYMRKIEHVIRLGSRAEVENAIHELFAALQQEHATLFTFRLLTDEILRILMAQWKGEEKQWNQIYNVFTLSRCLTADDFEAMLLEACHKLLTENTDAANEQSRLVEEAIRRMKADYGSADLTMTALAASLEVSPVTLAVEFKNETGLSPSDYLAMLRLDEAKRLLAETDQLVREISRVVGYEDDHVFIRRFKKYTGKTPGQYRRDMLGQRE